MPELPEVETIARLLREGSPDAPSIVGQTIAGCEITWHRTVAEPGCDTLGGRLDGQVVQTVGRRGKYLLIELTEDTLIIHLRMSGDLRVEPAGTEPQPHDRFWLKFEAGGKLVFNDPRKFGRVWLTDDPAHVLGRLGLDPFDDTLTSARFAKMLEDRRRRIKPLLQDQSFIAGIGNIYADEALFRAGIHPQRQSNAITAIEAAGLLEAIRKVLLLGIENNGASIDWVYRGGGFQNLFKVYGRTAEPCPCCGQPIAKIWEGQRGTHFCPHCQK